MRHTALNFSSRCKGIFSYLSSIGHGIGGMTGISAFFFFFLAFFFLGEAGLSGSTIFTLFPDFFASASNLAFSSSSYLFFSSSSSLAFASSSSSSAVFFFLAGHFFFFGAFASSISFLRPNGHS